MTTTTALLRSAMRMCGAVAAVVDVESELTVVGLSGSTAREVLAASRAGASLPGNLRLVCGCHVPLNQPGRAGTMFVFDRADASAHPVPKDALHVIAAEIGSELDCESVLARDGLSKTFDPTLGQIAGGIDSLNDAAAIFESPRIGSPARILYVNSAFETLLGYGAVAAIGESTDFLYGPLTDRARIEFMEDRVRDTRQARGAVVYYRSDGVPIWVEVSLRAVQGLTGGGWCVVATLRDVTTRKEFELAIAKEKRKLQVTLAAIGDGVITTVADGRVDFVNLAARTMFGIDSAEAYGQPLSETLRLADAQGGVIDILRGDDDTTVSRGQALFARGISVKHVAYVTSAIADEGYVIVLRDVTAQHRLATQLSYEAAHDPLTGMYNRRKFDEILEDAIEATQRGDGPHALAFLDLDRFKFINDTCGHAVGDRLLLNLAHLLQAQLRGRDVLARIGGDEFAVLLHECSLDNARRVLDKLRRAVEAYRTRYKGADYGVGVSIGVTAIDGSETDAAALFSQADAACYAAKHHGRNAVAG